MKARVHNAQYIIYNRTFELSLGTQRVLPEPSSISNLEPPCESHDVVWVDIIPNRTQPRQIRPIQGLNRRPKQRVIPVHGDVGDILSIRDGRGTDRVRALPQSGGDVSVF